MTSVNQAPGERGSAFTRPVARGGRAERACAARCFLPARARPVAGGGGRWAGSSGREGRGRRARRKVFFFPQSHLDLRALIKIGRRSRRYPFGGAVFSQLRFLFHFCFLLLYS